RAGGLRRRGHRAAARNGADPRRADAGDGRVAFTDLEEDSRANPISVRVRDRDVHRSSRRARKCVMRSLAGWCVGHRRVVVGVWLVVLIGLTVLGQSVGSAYKDSFTLNGTQSFEALSFLQKVAPKAAGHREQIVIAVKHGKVTDPAVRARVDSML